MERGKRIDDRIDWKAAIEREMAMVAEDYEVEGSIYVGIDEKGKVVFVPSGYCDKYKEELINIFFKGLLTGIDIEELEQIVEEVFSDIKKPETVQ